MIRFWCGRFQSLEVFAARFSNDWKLCGEYDRVKIQMKRLLAGLLMTALSFSTARALDGVPREKTANTNLAPRELPPIGLSCAMPLVGQTVMVTIPQATGETCVVSNPTGGEKRLSLDASGHARWTPRRYGKHLLRCGDVALEVWVLASPMSFHWWDERSDPRHATIVMTKRPDYWRSRGVIPVRWTVGEYASRTNGEYASRRYIQPEQWFNDWFGSTKGWNGMAMDEMYFAPEAPSPALAEAVALMRKKAGRDYVISVYSSGAEKGFDNGAGLLRESQALCMIESYYGDDKLFLKRWNDMKQYGLEKTTIFAIGPGFKLRPDCHGPLTETEVKEEFAKVRRVSPESPGIALYNAFTLADRATIQPGLDAACSQAIEDYFLKPVVCFVPEQKNGQKRLAAWNIGNEDAKGFLVQWLDDAAKSIGREMPLPTLRPQGQSSLAIPPGTRSLRLMNPAGTVNIYPGCCYDVQVKTTSR